MLILLQSTKQGLKQNSIRVRILCEMIISSHKQEELLVSLKESHGQKSQEFRIK